MLVLGPELLLAVVPRKRAAKLAAIFFDRNVIMWNTIYVCCVFVCVCVRVRKAQLLVLIILL
jgi:hypothetical protein